MTFGTLPQTGVLLWASDEDEEDCAVNRDVVDKLTVGVIGSPAIGNNTRSRVAGYNNSLNFLVG